MKREHVAGHWLENTGPIYAGYERAQHAFWVRRASGTDDWQLLATTAGQGAFHGDRGDLRAGLGSFILIPPGVSHDYAVDGKFWEYTWVHFQPQKEWVELMQWPKHDDLMELRVTDTAARQNIVSGLDQVVRYSKEPYHRRQQFMSNALESVLLQCDLWNPMSRHHDIDPRILAAMDFLRENFARDISLTDLAAKNCMSVSNLSHLFRKHVGIGPMKYLDLQRLEYARAMLENTDEAVNTIAGRAGFEFCYFSQHFKKYTMFSPRAYRARFRSI